MELKGPHGPHPSFPLGVSLTSLSRQTSRQTDCGQEEEEVVCCWSYFLQSGWGSGSSFVQRAGQCPWFSHTGIAFMKVKSSSGL